MNDCNPSLTNATAAFAQAAPADLENAKAQFLGKSGPHHRVMKGLAALPVDEKEVRGAAINRPSRPSRRR
jgi:phenylalanyl-tRNA synthetase alpha chain